MGLMSLLAGGMVVQQQVAEACDTPIYNPVTGGCRCLRDQPNGEVDSCDDFDGEACVTDGVCNGTPIQPF
jgi:hypothetical protein